MLEPTRAIPFVLVRDAEDVCGVVRVPAREAPDARCALSPGICAGSPDDRDVCHGIGEVRRPGELDAASGERHRRAALQAHASHRQVHVGRHADDLVMPERGSLLRGRPLEQGAREGEPLTGGRGAVPVGFQPPIPANVFCTSRKLNVRELGAAPAVATPAAKTPTTMQAGSKPYLAFIIYSSGRNGPDCPPAGVKRIYPSCESEPTARDGGRERAASRSR